MAWPLKPPPVDHKSKEFVELLVVGYREMILLTTDGSFRGSNRDKELGKGHSPFNSLSGRGGFDPPPLGPRPKGISTLNNPACPFPFVLATLAILAAP